ncbi:TetR/AcrR family transcriptional regulator [Micrococcus sp. KRD077]|uniref:TetR/AcrR family transcriptional regulator n=1 Tax=Micrococcus sp. KRD077 TaxID=2729720 RepID=UPI001F49578D|nr:TetR/AcrR family transcriptional regulator [Micrococcus sp. KRD077]
MRADARANRQDLLAAAGRLIATQGAAMSLRGVAQEAGVGVGTLYRHFPTRRDLLDAVLEDVVARTGGILQAFLDGVLGRRRGTSSGWGGPGCCRSWCLSSSARRAGAAIGACTPAADPLRGLRPASRRGWAHRQGHEDEPRGVRLIPRYDL